MNQYRTHNCGELRDEHIGQTVRLSGWVENIRDHGGVTFLDIRDQYGITQVVLHDADIKITRESVVTVSGNVKRREEDTINQKIETGTIELHAAELELQSMVSRTLPFEVRESKNSREEIRLRHRFLDLRNPAVKNNILLRSRVCSFLRSRMENLGFAEIQTPILTSSSPEGARDYLVPSRKHRGKFYALPQAPQIFKQLLMVSGFDRYFQIAPCFRDEDARADRTPGEFYQLDFEMAFADQDDVFHVAQTVLHELFSTFSTKQISPLPFRKITYADALLKYGTDKPDLRNPLLIEDLTDFFSDVDFPPFKDIPVRGIVGPRAALQPKSFFEKMLAFAVEIGMKGLGYISVLEDDANASASSLKGPIVKYLSEAKQSELRAKLSLQKNDTLFFIADNPNEVNWHAGEIRTALGNKLNLINKDKFEFCFIVDFPMYERNEETGAVEFSHNPFSMPQGGFSALNNKEPLDILAWQYDLICNGVELSSGAVRNHLPELMLRAFEISGYSKDDIERKFPSLYNAFHYGAPPHAGMAPGLDRIVMLLAEEENIREVVAFPMNSNAQDLLLQAPCDVTEQQLREVHIRLLDKQRRI